MRQTPTAVLVTIVLLSAAGTCDARPRHRSAAAAQEPGDRPAQSFYPQEVEGGVSGNLPFNNQVRKHTDPLNANGAR